MFKFCVDPMKLVSIGIKQALYKFTEMLWMQLENPDLVACDQDSLENNLLLESSVNLK